MTAKTFVAGGKPAVVATPRRKFKTLDEEAANLRLFLYGPPGTGKTYLLAQLIEAGYKALILDSDIGGPGTNTIVSYLKDKGKKELLKNVIRLTFEGYPDVRKFLDEPHKNFEVLTDIKWDDFRPDIISWDGFGNWQQVDVFQYSLDFNGGNSATEQREAGLQAAMQDWGIILKATTKAFNDFCKIEHPDGMPIFKIVTAHEDDREIDPTGARMKPGDFEQAKRAKLGHKPLLSGRAAKVVPGGADYVIRTYSLPTTGGGTVYGWDLSNQGGLNEGKVRGKMLTGGPNIKFENGKKPIDLWAEMCKNVDIEFPPKPKGLQETEKST